VNLTSEQINFFNTNGYIILRNIVSESDIIDAKISFDKLMKRFSEECNINYESYKNTICQLRDLWRYEPVFEKFTLDSILPNIASKLMGRPAARLLHDHLINKPLGNSSTVPWHQDYPYWPVDHSFGLSTWLPLDKVDSNSGALEVIKGSHLCGEEKPVDFINESRVEFDNHPKKEVLEVNTGDVVFLHSLTWHKTGPNHSMPFRRAYINLWIPPESRYTPLHSDWHPVNYNVTVKEGELLNEDWFPIVGDKDNLENYPSGKIKFKNITIEDEDLTMYNASKQIKTQLSTYLSKNIKEYKYSKKDAYEYLLDDQHRMNFIQSLNQSQIKNTISIADQCLKNLCINSVAWKKHKARNIYNQYYIDFVNIFNLS
jgi:ectoine hydroxylase-related dioxygenase (phytanoyl-CoA dioxygenase family)